MSSFMDVTTCWTAELKQTVSQPPIVLGDLLIIASQPSGAMAQHGTVSAVSLNDGQLQWQQKLEYSLVSGLAIHQWQGQDVVIVTSSSSDFLNGRGNLLALNPSGEEVWRWQVEAEHFSAPATLGDTVVVVVGGKTLTLIDSHGDEERIPLTAHASLAAPLVAHNVAYISCRSSDLLAVELNGEEQWHFTFDGNKQDWLDKTPVIADSSVVATSSRGSIFVLEQATGKLIWQEVLGEGRNTSPPAADGEHIYVGCKQGVVALAVGNTPTQWTFVTPRPITAKPLVLRDHLLVTSEDHKLYALDKKTGKEQWHFELPRRIEMPPLLTETAILVADRGGNVVALPRPSELVYEPVVAAIEPTIMRQQRWEKAERFEEDKQYLKAAELWFELEELERAAVQYEAGEDWLAASKLWRQIDRYIRRAEALKRHAQNLSQSQANDEEKAKAWENASRVFAEMGKKKERDTCQQEVARYRRLPILNIRIESEEMHKNAWAKVKIMVKNNGFGPAVHLAMQLKDDRFEGQISGSQTMVTLPIDGEFVWQLDVRPRHQGSSVPMRINIEYLVRYKGSQKLKPQILERTFYLQVADEVTRIITGELGTGSLSATGSREALVGLPTPEGVDLRILLDNLRKYFKRDELIEVLFDMKISEENFSDQIKPMTLELVIALARNGRIEELVAICERERPNVNWRSA